MLRLHTGLLLTCSWLTKYDLYSLTGYYSVAGPTLLFERYVSEQSLPRRYYACSACRSRKECQFFQWADRQKPQKQSVVEHQRKEATCYQLHKASFSRQDISCMCCNSFVKAYFCGYNFNIIFSACQCIWLTRSVCLCLQCFDTVGWTAGRASIL